MATPRLDPAARKWLPRRYDTPDGLRLNVYAIEERFGIDPRTFRRKQIDGWSQRGGGAFTAVFMPWQRGVEDTYLESELAEALEAPPPDGRFPTPPGAVYGPDGKAEQGQTFHGFELDTERVMAELGVTRSTLHRWDRHCGPLEDAPLLFRWDRSTVSGHWTRRYPEALVEQIKRADAAARSGVYRSPKHGTLINTDRLLVALRSIRPGLTERTVSEWVTGSCYHLGGDKLTAYPLKLDLGVGGPVNWHPIGEVVRIRRSLIAERDGVMQTPDGRELLTRTAAARAGCASFAAIRNWDKEGVLLPEKVVANRRGGPGKRRRYYCPDAIREVYRARTAPRPETFDDGRRITLAKAADLLEVNRTWLLVLIKRGDADTIGALAPERLKAEGPGKPRTMTVLKEGVAQLKRHWAEELAAGRLGPNWLTSCQIGERYGLTGVLERIALKQVLAEFRGTEFARRVRRKIRGVRMRVWFYDVEGIRGWFTNPDTIRRGGPSADCRGAPEVMSPAASVGGKEPGVENEESLPLFAHPVEPRPSQDYWDEHEARTRRATADGMVEAFVRVRDTLSLKPDALTESQRRRAADGVKAETLRQPHRRSLGDGECDDDTEPRPEVPSADYCLRPPNLVRWEGEAELQQRLWHLLGALLRLRVVDKTTGKGRPISFDAVESQLNTCKKSKTLMNDVAALTAELDAIEFPWRYSTKSQYVTEE
jgi:hypothetical protein